MKLTHDPRRNIAYLRLREKTGEVETLKVGEDMIIDIAPDGTVFGIELLNANEQLAGADGLTVSSAAFGPGGAIPAEYSCMVSPDGPPLSWSQVPTGTVELAVVVTDLGARDFVQWIVTGIPPDVDRLDPPAFPEGAQQGINDTGETGWFGPCPAPGERRQYLFSLYPVTAPLDLPAGTGGRDAAAAIAEASLEPATVAGFYTAA